MNFKAVILVFLIAGAAMAVSVDGVCIEKDRHLNLAAVGLKTLDVNCGSGYLKIKGSKDATQIEVRATIVVKGMDADELDKFIADRVRLSLTQKGNEAVLISQVEGGGLGSIFGNRSALINLDITVPERLDLEIDDGSGNVEISYVNGNIHLDDGSGNIVMESVGGDVEIDDGSGALTLDRVGGNVEVKDGSGSISIVAVKGNVDVNDSSGGLTIKEVGGSVLVDDGSGGILIDGVAKDVRIKNAGSGGLTIHNVKGQIIK